MKHKFTRVSERAGMPPGTLISSKREAKGPVTTEMINYTPSDIREKKLTRIEEGLEPANSDSITWININGIHDISVIEQAGRIFNLHPLLLEDILNPDQRAKIDDYGDYLYITLKMIYIEDPSDDIKFEQVSLIVGEKYVISFQERKGDVFNPVRNRLRSDKGRIRKMGADYLLYALIDSIVDNYFVIPEHFGDKIDTIEFQLLSEPSIETLQVIHKMKRELIFLRKAVWPLREVISNIERSESKIIKKTTALYLRDVYNHTIQVADTIETFRDMLSGMVDLYMSSLSNKTNEIMKVLTIIATIFIPLTFIAGVYGMNFKYMPELEWKASYFVVLGIMLAIGIGMLWFFRKKKWL
ncbi:MAG: magnesium/cobalt transporter CorA [Elusimicrobiota bacterium]